MPEATKPLIPKPSASQSPTQLAPASSPTEIHPTVAEVMQVCPDADKQEVAKGLPYILREMAANKLTTKNQLVAIVATIYTENRSFASSGEKGQGGGKYGRYYGRGWIQLTHESNYRRATQDLKIDFINNPDLASLPENSAKIFVWFWKGATGNNPASAADRGDWRGVRKAVNGGYNGWEIFAPTIERAIQVFKSGIDPNSIPNLPAPGDYALGCADPGVGGSRTLSGGQFNPTSQAEALAYALGLHTMARGKAIEMRGCFDVSQFPELLKLDVQKTIEVQNAGAGLDGNYNIDELLFTFDRSLTLDLFAFQPDPNAPPPQVFLHDANQPLTNSSAQTVGSASTVPAGEIPNKIFETAKSMKGTSSRDGPGRGKVACAYMVNKVLEKAIGHKIGTNPNLVVSVEAALKSEYAQEVIPRTQGAPGDIVTMVGPGSKQHIGIVMANGCTNVLSNSSSSPPGLRWEAPIETYDKYYSCQCRVWRVTK